MIKCRKCGEMVKALHTHECPKRVRYFYEKHQLKELTEEQKAKNLEHNTGIEPRPAPALPDGYRVDNIFGDLTLSHWEGRMVACLYRTNELGIPARVASAKDTEAIIAFLKGAR